MKDWVLTQLNDDGYPEGVLAQGDEVVSFRGEVWVIAEGVGSPPHKPASTGKVWVKQKEGDFSQEFYPGVFNCRWVQREED